MAVGRPWAAAMTRAVFGAVLSRPRADEQWLRAHLAEVSEHLPAGYCRAPPAPGPAGDGRGQPDAGEPGADR